MLLFTNAGASCLIDHYMICMLTHDCDFVFRTCKCRIWLRKTVWSQSSFRTFASPTASCQFTLPLELFPCCDVTHVILRSQRVTRQSLICFQEVEGRVLYGRHWVLRQTYLSRCELRHYYYFRWKLDRHSIEYCVSLFLFISASVKSSLSLGNERRITCKLFEGEQALLHVRRLLCFARRVQIPSKSSFSSTQVSQPRLWCFIETLMFAAEKSVESCDGSISEISSANFWWVE